MAEQNIGIIGQTYEDRKSKKRGVLESRAPKYKTLMLRDSDGNSFNITFSTFKSNWRKYTGDDVIETSEQKTEKREKAEKEIEQVKEDIQKPKKVSKGKKCLFTREQKNVVLKEVAKLIENILVECESDLKVKTNSKGGAVIKNASNKTVFEAWPDFTSNPIAMTKVYMHKELWDEVVFSKRVGDVEADFHEKWILKFGAKIKQDVFDEAIRDILKAVKIVYADTDEKKDKKNKKEEE